MNSKHDNLWDLLVKYNFEVITKDSRDLICVMCKRLLVNAHQSCCGCRYCYDCIEKYLEDKKKLCPGKGEDCKDQLISIFDVQVDHVANVKISKVYVKCPDSLCQFKDELRKMEIHIKSHQIKCPYFEIGCSKADINNSSFNNHMEIEHGNHASLLMDSIQNMKNDIATLQEESLRKNEEIVLTHKLWDNVRIANNQNEEVIETLKSEINENKLVVKNLKIEVANLNNELKNFKKTFGKKENQINSLAQELAKLRQESKKPKNEKLRNENKNFSLGFSSTNDQLVPSGKIKKEPQNSIIQCTNIINGVQYSPFIWKIANFSDKKNAAKNVVDSFILSCPFYSHLNGYKMCLKLFPDGSNTSQNAWLCVGFHLMLGEHDNNLSWPMMMNVTIGLVNQKSNEVHISETYNFSYAPDNNKDKFFKPVFGLNEAIVGHKFIKFAALSSNGNLCKKDCIVIKCIVEKNETNFNITSN